MPRSFDIAVIVRGNYLVEPPGAPGARGLLVGFHGYAETAERHLEELRRLALSPPWRLCAVQALHPFYRNRGAEVVASWMTRFDRERAIASNLRYVGDVVAALRSEYPDDGPLAFAGFSQGAAMAYRAAQRAGHACAAVVALGGDVPPDVVQCGLDGFPPVLIGRGSGDEWYTEDALSRDVDGLERAGVRVEVCRFEGGHEWSPAFREAAARFLVSLVEPPADAAPG